MTAVIFLLILAAAPLPAEKEVTAAEKKTFLELLAKLPAKGEFFTEEAINKSVPYTHVLLAFTEKDIEKQDIYPFLALSRGLLDRKKQQEYGVKHFDKIAHPTIKLFWGVVLFEEKVASPEIVTFLRMALESREQAKILSQMRGPNFEDFKKRVIEYKVKKK